MREKPFKTVETGWVILIGISAGLLLTGILSACLPMQKENQLYEFFLIGGFVLVLLLFYNMTIIIDDEYVFIKMGIGLIRKKIPLNDIASCRPVKNKPWYGWGIRFLPDMTIYTVSGLDAIEISLKSKKRKIRIGSREPHVISNLINEKIGVE